MKILKATDLNYIVKQYSNQPQLWKLYDLVAMYHDRGWLMSDLEEVLVMAEDAENGVEVGDAKGTFLYELSRDMFEGDVHGAA